MAPKHLDSKLMRLHRPSEMKARRASLISDRTRAKRKDANALTNHEGRSFFTGSGLAGIASSHYVPPTTKKEKDCQIWDAFSCLPIIP